MLAGHEHNIFTTMPSLKIMDKGTQVLAIIPSTTTNGGGGGCGEDRVPASDLLEPQIEPCLNSVDFVETVADVYRRNEERGQACWVVVDAADIETLNIPRLVWILTVAGRCSCLQNIQANSIGGGGGGGRVLLVANG
ncbi:hypothetical protein M0R45_017459 [Rubus argutus]|uniref:Uncharacterized protein n=1 Tax=Rubus argutus TaxID=59490 RepID=A0AAW1XWB6_RUBAR